MSSPEPSDWDRSDDDPFWPTEPAALPSEEEDEEDWDDEDFDDEFDDDFEAELDEELEREIAEKFADDGFEDPTRVLDDDLMDDVIAEPSDLEDGADGIEVEDVDEDVDKKGAD